MVGVVDCAGFRIAVAVSHVVLPVGEAAQHAGGRINCNANCNDKLRAVQPRASDAKCGRSSPRGESVKISTPLLVTATVCSNCADSERSRVTAVQPSESTFTCGRPRLIIGSTV